MSEEDHGEAIFLADAQAVGAVLLGWHVVMYHDYPEDYGTFFLPLDARMAQGVCIKPRGENRWWEIFSLDPRQCRMNVIEVEASRGQA